MAVTVVVSDEQSERPVDTERWSGLAQAILGAEGITGDAELSLLFVDATTIAELNETHLGHEGPTDVLSFPIDARPSTFEGGPDPTPSRVPVPVLLGDVVVCPEVAFANAPDHAGTYEDELALLVVHGILHVLGMDHEDPDEADAMEAREQALLAAHHRRLL